MWRNLSIFAPRAFYCATRKIAGLQDTGQKHNNMATITAFIRVSTKKAKQANVRFRLRDGRAVSLVYASKIQVKPDFWDAKKEGIKAKAMMMPDERAAIETAIRETKNLISKLYAAQEDKAAATSSWLRDAIDRAQHPEKYEEKPRSFIEQYAYFIECRDISEIRKRAYRVMTRDLQRYELYRRHITGPRDFTLTFDGVTADTLRDFDKFLQKEHEFFTKDEETGAIVCAPEYKPIYDAVPECRTPEQRGQNTRSEIFSRIRTFYNWAIDNGLTNNNPFLHFKIRAQIYGDPYYLFTEEIEKLYNTDLSKRPALAIQRDIFVFQSNIGCRVGDLYSLTKNSIIDGAVEYIPHKTKEGRPTTTRVPLTPTAAEIIERYKDNPGPELLPFISSQKYNKAIKEFFKLAGLTRPVTILNPTTRESEIKPLDEIASSHLARRNFAGNNYRSGIQKEVICAMTGHSPNSRAFNRYYKVDEKMKTDAILKVFGSIGSKK